MLSPVKPFSLGFTALSLRPELTRIMAEAFTNEGTWQKAKTRVLTQNAFQARTAKSSSRIEAELRRRLSSLTPRQLELLAAGSLDCRSSLAWLSVLKTTPLAFAFASDFLRQKLEGGDRCLRLSDYEDFFLSQSSLHPFLAALSSSTKVKMRSVLLNMLRQTGILHRSAREDFLQRPVIPSEVYGVILADDPRWLAGFLVPEHEIVNSAS
ncbi:MAG: hypothetical protein RLZZ142_874 [Verrucomicrobiota bacterium]